MPTDKELQAQENEQRAKTARGDHAKRILEDEMFKGAIQTIRDKALRDFKQAKPSDGEALMRARMQFDVTEQFINALTKILGDGKIAQNRLDDILAAKELKKHGG